jgi:Transposase
VDHVSVQEAFWLIARPFDDLKADERRDLQELCQAHAQLATLHTLVQSFGQIVRKRQGPLFSDWSKQVAESGLSEVQRFATGLERDKEAVLAGLMLVYSNGQVEAQVNKLKRDLAHDVRKGRISVVASTHSSYAVASKGALQMNNDAGTPNPTS